MLDEILKAHRLPFERHVYVGLGHGFNTPAAFEDGVRRTAAFFGGSVDEPEPAPTSVQTSLSMVDGLSASTDGFFDFGDDDGFFAWQTSTVATWAIFAPKKKPKRLLVKKAAKTRAVAAQSTAAKP